MKLFISWSGPLSQQVANVLRDWIPKALQSVNPFMSASDVDKGARWAINISQELSESDYGIICVTPDNIGSPWLNFEAGAISKSIERGRVSPFLFRVKSSNITGPLVHFQHTVYSRPDVFQLVKSINNACADPIPEARLLGVFDVWWPKLTEPLDAIRMPSQESPARSSEDMLAELIDLMRGLRKSVPVVPIAPVTAGNSRQAHLAEQLSEVRVSYLDKTEVSFLLARLQLVTDLIAHSQDLHDTRIVQMRGLVALLVKQLVPMVGPDIYSTSVRAAKLLAGS